MIARVGVVPKRTIVGASELYPHSDDHTIRTTDSPGFKPFTLLNLTTVTTLTCSRRFDFSLITVICDFSSAFSSKQTKEEQLAEFFDKEKLDFFN